ncbi:ABC transporter substrate-binding protein [Niveispirillum sp. SYP-B3756]|uniref:ABC transporter substrate-binding protein n=1 Tax=Niveispirillum sp. SYP-B3756 TaxID=2662178 RepID=UPI001291F814|nr:ABC transporter substrate-binding protein [Niveispirillum sp. SYP-B3756]MQP66164.1 ABC transporter substrate-binding protein [Niveispirillum sp. SYP-B3756]
MGLSRRTLLTAGMAASALPLLPAWSQAAAAPRTGGRIRVAGMSSSTADTTDPAKGALSTDYIRHHMLYSGLTEYGADLRPRLALAEAMESSDQISWRVKLRDGVRFHDGKRLNAEDVVFSLTRHLDPAGGSKVRPIASQFAEIRATGPLDLTITLTGPNVDLPAMLAQSHFLIIAAGAKDFSRPNGTGPYRIKSFVPGVSTIVTRNEDFWKPGKPYLDEIELIGIPDEVSRVNALLSGDVQMVIAVNPRSIHRIRESGAHEMLETPSGLYTNLIMRVDGGITGNPDFMLGMKYLFDRELVKRALFRGSAIIANDHPIPPFHPFFRADLPQRSFDLDRARYHFAKAGLGPARLPVYASTAAEGSVDMGSALQEYGARAGLNLAINRMPADGYWSTHWMKHPLSFGNTNPRATADLVFSQFYKSTAAWNETGWKNERFDRLLLEARATANEPLRAQIYGEMQEIVSNHCGTAIPVFINLSDGYDKRLKGLYPVPVGGFMGYAFAEHVWWEG